MKKLLTLAAVALISLSTLTVNAQNKFKGIVKYKVESTGQTAFQVPEEMATAQIKVLENKVYATNGIFSGNADNILVDGMKTVSCLNLGQILGYLRSNGSEFTYQGDGKIKVVREFTQSDVDSLTIPVEEGFYIEYVAGETKNIAGVTAKKAILHVFTDEGDKPLTMWYDETMGPQPNFLFNGINGVPLQYTQELGEGREITITCTEIVKGKVKDVDFLMPSGYEQLSQEDLNVLMTELQEEIELLQGE